MTKNEFIKNVKGYINHYLTIFEFTSELDEKLVHFKLNINSIHIDGIRLYNFNITKDKVEYLAEVYLPNRSINYKEGIVKY